jgi:hypothetical protein
MAQRIIKTAHRIIEAGRATEEPPSVDGSRVSPVNEAVAGVSEEVMPE